MLRSLSSLVVGILTLCFAQPGWGVNACSPLPAATAPGFEQMLQSYLDAGCYRSAGWQHDPQVRGTGGVHPNVKVWYSPKIWEWLTLLGPER